MLVFPLSVVWSAELFLVLYRGAPQSKCSITWLDIGLYFKSMDNKGNLVWDSDLCGPTVWWSHHCFLFMLSFNVALKQCFKLLSGFVCRMWLCLFCVAMYLNIYSTKIYYAATIYIKKLILSLLLLYLIPISLNAKNLQKGVFL